MKVKLLGSAAAEGFPGLWCTCPTCQAARKAGGKDIRRRTSYLIDDDTIVDLGPDFMWQVTEFGIDTSKLRNVIFTHAHGDHENPYELIFRCGGFGNAKDTLDIYGGRTAMGRVMATVAMVDNVVSEEWIKSRLHVIWRQGERIEAKGIAIIPFDADHDYGRNAYIYALERNGRKVVLFHDSGLMLKPDTWKLMEGIAADAVVLDCTGAIAGADWANHHMGVSTSMKARDKLLEIGAIKDGAKVLVNHFSHNGHALHADLERHFHEEGSGVAVGYDGLEFEV